MVFTVLLALALALPQLSLLLAVLCTPFLFFALVRTTIGRWGSLGAQSPLFFIASAVLFSFIAPRSWETWLLLGGVLLVMFVFAEDESGVLPAQGSLLGPVLRRAPVLVFLGLYLWCAAAASVASFNTAVGVPFAVLVGFLAASAARWLLDNIKDVRKGQTRPYAERLLEALVFGLVGGEAVLAIAFTPFAALVRATILVTIFWTIEEVGEAFEQKPLAVERVAGATVVGVGIIALLFLTAPWP